MPCTCRLQRPPGAAAAQTQRLSFSWGVGDPGRQSPVPPAGQAAALGGTGHCPEIPRTPSPPTAPGCPRLQEQPRLLGGGNEEGAGPGEQLGASGSWGVGLGWAAPGEPPAAARPRAACVARAGSSPAATLSRRLLPCAPQGCGRGSLGLSSAHPRFLGRAHVCIFAV